MMSRIKKINMVALVGGTHGNERNGINIVNYIKRLKQNNKLSCKSFNLELLQANTRAIQACQRYMDEDLNRCFLKSRLYGDNNENTYEMKLAKEINNKLGPKNKEPKTDFILDLHNTTSNSGLMLCFHRDDLLAKEIFAYLYSRNSNIKALLWSSKDDVPFLPSIGKSGFTLEVGACAHGTVNANIIQNTLDVVLQVLSYIEYRNKVSTDNFAEMKTVAAPIHERLAEIDYPHEDMFIHSKLQGVPELEKELTSNQEIFQSLDGKSVVKYDPEDYGLTSRVPAYPVFVNEAAYYEKNIALCLAKRSVENLEYFNDSLQSNL